MLIKIKNLKLKTIIGVHEWEEKIDREIIINAEIETDKTDAINSDRLSDTIDYDVIITDIKNLVENNRFNLIEKLAGEIMKKIMKNRNIKRCRLEVDKVGVVDCVESFSITIEQNGY
ncbi:MAG: dihydroneopterin aldolase [Alphaproteobacteria bacterium RIFCSPLOWO2_01_FULL_40_26]|nr:MAG: dihydroneopterin aldolase [Alphaproteobacteria bacterium RIFCSPHIGHO2_02_FULL_40_34]OFW87558.1 MAG: dihydroneopterin aldolase [Alphaproteobacteria bacterium RIFCSPHIGHO2_01_FULL_40_8]OFW94484.1 MAG: dihydroneopterin aldolase [Alphaproteobacteria bacterium RIFCSPLOWO2_01_FULL_40_26]OFX10195.1 MAG: dihydroneopterin aldolase [Alphaproteobacteria bacterium RIFCSPLOWO2_02_FULL_40_19]OFX11218.1 MAG: dihydroneopterin aldolase [Alphaproteobacteria bacterium RIFCSPLOWO2_12_FULL_40_11]